MCRYLVKNRRLIVGVVSALFVATAFNTGGCTITVDEDLVNQVTDWLSSLEPDGFSIPGPPGSGDDHGGADAHCGDPWHG
jgi:hypothetical protein